MPAPRHPRRSSHEPRRSTRASSRPEPPVLSAFTLVFRHHSHPQTLGRWSSCTHLLRPAASRISIAAWCRDDYAITSSAVPRGVNGEPESSHLRPVAVFAEDTCHPGPDLPASCSLFGSHGHARSSRRHHCSSRLHVAAGAPGSRLRGHESQSPGPVTSRGQGGCAALFPAAARAPP